MSCTYGDLTDEAVTITVRGGSVPGARQVTLWLEPVDLVDPVYVAFRSWFLARSAARVVAEADKPSFGPIG